MEHTTSKCHDCMKETFGLRCEMCPDLMKHDVEENMMACVGEPVDFEK